MVSTPSFLNTPPDRGHTKGWGNITFLQHTVLIITVFLGTTRSVAAAEWFVDRRTPELTAIIICTIIVLLSLWIARRKKIYVRPLPGLQAIDDALGRATELGSPVVYITGWGGDLSRPTTMASMAILSHLAERAAGFNTRILFPSHDPVVTSAAEDTIRQGYSAGGHPDLFRSDDITFVTQSQLGYAAAVDGIMARTRPGAVFLLGTFEGEALILAETAHSVGAMQIAGTDSTIQLSFFLVACDYTLIGEELFAASGYLSGDPAILGAIFGQDLLKILIVSILIIGFLLALAGVIDISPWLGA